MNRPKCNNFNYDTIFKFYFFVQRSLKKYEVSEEITEERVDEDIKWMLLPSGRGDTQLAIISGLERNDVANQVEPLVDHIKFYLYTR